MDGSGGEARRILQLHNDDNIAVAIDGLPQGTTAGGVTARNRIMKGHKMAMAPIAEGAPILKFGQIIGFATEGIETGDHVHEHNCAVKDFNRDYQFAEAARDETMVAEAERRTFEGYRRSNGTVGTRNYLGVLTSVNCSATVARFIADAANRDAMAEAFPNVDGVVAFVHGTGCCGMAASGEGFEALQRVTWGYAGHPNLAGVLLVGLGCEAFQIPRLMKEYNIEESDHFRSFTIQQEGGNRKTIDRAMGTLHEMLPRANQARREICPASEIKLALQCGGSDGYSGITANPSLGAAVDELVRQGGTGILAETPEIYGAEHLLTRRAENRDVGEKLVGRIKWWKDYTHRNGGEMNNNPSPGNKAGGLTAILEKSLGAAAKGGTTTLRGVYNYAERIDRSGFVFMDSPGYDPCSVTGQVASGANVVCFTTGRGSAFGYKPAPSIKLATNSDMYARMEEDMDINCGDVLNGISIKDKGREILDKILTVASGTPSKSEELG